MSDVKWIKLSVNMFNDEKIKLIRTMPEGDKIIVTWVQLLCLAGKTNDGGGIYMGQNIYYTDEMLATLCDQPVNIMRIALKTLQQFGMIEWLDSGLIQITNWEKHQSTDKMARMKEQTRIRQQRYYYRNKLRELGVNVDAEGFTDDLDELKDMLEKEEVPNVRLALANDTEVRSKKKEVRSKKKEVNEESPAEAERIPYKKIIDYLNEQAGRSYYYKAKTNRTLIRARWNGRKEVDKDISDEELLEQFKSVIDKKVADANDKKHGFESEYLRPTTLFAESNFDTYLNQPKRSKQQEGKIDTDDLWEG